MSSDEDRLLFEAAVAELEGASKSKIKRAKAGAGGGARAGALEASTNRPRLDKRLRSAEPEGSIDLHGLEAKLAQAQLLEFLQRHRRSELILVVHGKGKGILRRRVVEVLEADRRVVEHVQAPQRLGGSGARLIRLRRR